MNYLLAFLAAATLSAVLTPLVTRLAKRIGAIDMPGGRKIHAAPIARLGGLAMAASFVIVVLATNESSRRLWGMIVGMVVLVTVGVIDDIKDLGPWTKLFWQIVAAMLALAGGIGIVNITSPFGGVISLDWGHFLVHIGTIQFRVLPVANFLSIVWIVGLINAINFLDGLDGLAAGVSGIAALAMFFLAAGARVHQPEVALIAITLAGSAFGFLPYNFFPAKIFMGDSGSYFLGLTLALLAIYSGAKLATAVLVLGLPIIDSLWVVTMRLYRKVSPFQSDRGHLHHRMLDAGLSQRQAVCIFYLITAGFGLMALGSGSFGKFLALLALAPLVVLMILTLVLLSWRRLS